MAIRESAVPALADGVLLRRGDLLRSSAQTLVNPVNCVGAMGRGLALQFKREYPAMFSDYSWRCAAGELRPGKPQLWRPGAQQLPLDGAGAVTGTPGHWILNFPTKRHWRESSRIDDIAAGLDWLNRHHRSLGIESLAVPALGCGEGGLVWADVFPLLNARLGSLGIPVELYEPSGGGADRGPPGGRRPGR